MVKNKIKGFVFKPAAKIVNHLNSSNSSHLYEVNNEDFDLKTYKKFLSFLKFQEMTEKYDT